MILVDGADKVFFYQHVPGLVEPFWDHFGIPPPKKKPGKTMPQTQHPQKLGCQAPASSPLFYPYRSFFGGCIFCLQQNKASPEALKHLAFGLRGVSRFP